MPYYALLAGVAMAVSEQVAALFTIAISLVVVLLIVAVGWWLIWKVFLSRFEFVNELLFPAVDSERSSGDRQRSLARRKARKD